jgi:F-type H+-transporting ATPase subunit delta
MFHGDRWAAAFINVLGENAESGLACLRAMTPPVKKIRGVLFGRFAAKELEKTLRAAVDRPGAAPECAIRFISLLVEKNRFRHIDLILEKIEKKIDEQKGILDLTAESAVPMDGAAVEDLRRMLLERTGAAGIKMKTRLVPELLGGCRLRIGGLCIDASLKGQIETMTANLAAP